MSTTESTTEPERVETAGFCVLRNAKQYLEWRMMLFLALSIKQLGPHVDPKHPKYQSTVLPERLPEDAPESEKEKRREERKVFLRKDAEATSMLYARLDRYHVKLLLSTMDIDRANHGRFYARELFQQLEKLVKPPRKQTYFTARKQYYSTTLQAAKGDVEQYIDKFFLNYRHLQLAAEDAEKEFPEGVCLGISKEAAAVDFVNGTTGFDFGFWTINSLCSNPWDDLYTLMGRLREASRNLSEQNNGTNTARGKSKAKSKNQDSSRPCQTCHKNNHSQANCWFEHPELRPKRQPRRNQPRA